MLPNFSMMTDPRPLVTSLSWAQFAAFRATGIISAGRSYFNSDRWCRPKIPDMPEKIGKMRKKTGLVSMFDGLL
jgi:hypothetical protein